MKLPFPVSLDKELVDWINSVTKKSQFRNKSHLVEEAINEFKKKGSAVLLITHREEIALIADRASQLCGGKIVCSGSPGKVADYYKSRQCLLCRDEVCAYV